MVRNPGGFFHCHPTFVPRHSCSFGTSGIGISCVGPSPCCFISLELPIILRQYLQSQPRQELNIGYFPPPDDGKETKIQNVLNECCSWNYISNQLHSQNQTGEKRNLYLHSGSIKISIPKAELLKIWNKRQVWLSNFFPKYQFKYKAFLLARNAGYCLQKWQQWKWKSQA